MIIHKSVGFIDGQCLSVCYASGCTVNDAMQAVVSHYCIVYSLLLNIIVQ